MEPRPAERRSAAATRAAKAAPRTPTPPRKRAREPVAKRPPQRQAPRAAELPLLRPAQAELPATRPACSLEVELAEPVATTPAPIAAWATSQDIIVIDDAASLWAFDPLEVGAPAGPFTRLERSIVPSLQRPLPLQCGVAPFSLAVDRAGRAWVLYTTGQLFLVDLRSLDCTLTSFSVTQKWQLFQLAFSATASGSAN